MAADGSDQRRLTDSPGVDRAPAVSPDGQRIAFLSDRNGDLDVFVMTADGTDVHALSARSGNEYSPIWSPNGEDVASTFWQGCKRGLQIIRHDGSNRRKARVDVTDLTSICYSPDGTRIAGAYTSFGDSGLVVVDLTAAADAPQETKLVNVSSAKPVNAEWYRTGTGTPRMVARTFSGVRFAPDGQTLLYCSDQAAGGNYMLYTIPVTGGDPKPLGSTGGAWPMNTDWGRVSDEATERRSDAGTE